MGSGLYVGLMSGTSLDGVDAVLVRLGQGPRAAHNKPGQALVPADPPQVLGFVHRGFSPDLRSDLLALNAPGQNELHRAALAASGLARVYAQAVAEALHQAACAPADVVALGAHGQTVRHRPGEFDGLGYTIQLLNGALLAELSGVTVVCDFRSRDVAAGGQGAPLVPAFHAQVFARAEEDVAVLNLGGIANLSLLPAQTGRASHADQTVRGFDCGPGNVLMDLWCQRQRGLAFDADGAWAASGQVIPALLAAALADPYFTRLPPKSTGRDLFNADWMANCLARCGSAALAGPDVQATWAQLSAHSAITALAQALPGAQRLVVCGGGARNLDLMRRLTALGEAALPGLQVLPSDAQGVPAEQVEALAFAWLAQAAMQAEAGNLPAVTGARGPRVLGAIYPA